MSYSLQRISSIPQEYEDEEGEIEKEISLEKALELSPKLREFANKCPELMEYAKKIVGLPATFSSHAAGLIISDVPIVEFAPVRIDKKGTMAIQHEKHRTEECQLVKIDFLGLSTLDILDEILKSIKKLNLPGIPETIDDIPLDDKETYKMIQEGRTKCVFQFGKSTMMQGLCKRFKPENIEDLAIINALGRPSSSNEERSECLGRRLGKKEIAYEHLSLKNSLSGTVGLCIYEEQLMGVAKDVAGWDLNKADGLRKLTKYKGKEPALAEKLMNEFIEGAMKVHNITCDEAKNIWMKVVDKFQGYGFNKSHSVAYSINGYYTAYLKCHYPAAFFAAYLNVKTNSSSQIRDEEIAIAKAECRKMGVSIISPDINKSGMGYEVIDEKTIAMGMMSLKGMGDKAVEDIFANQPFTSFLDFIYRTDNRVVNKSKIEALAKAGCFDSMGLSRKAIFEEGKKIKEKLAAFIKKKEKDHQDITMALEEFPVSLSKEDWSKKEKLMYEQEVLGELVSGTITDMYPGFFSKLTPPFGGLS